MDLYSVKEGDKVWISSSGNGDLYEVAKVTAKQIHVWNKSQNQVAFKFWKTGVEISPVYRPHQIKTLRNKDLEKILRDRKLNELRYKITTFFRDRENRLTDEQVTAIASILNIE